MPEKKVEKALKIVGIVLLVFIVIFASAVTTLYLRARRRRATHRTTLIHQIPLSSQTSGSANVSSSRGPQQAARKKSLRERERMNLAFGVVDDDETRAGTPTPAPYGVSSVSMPASSATMANPFGALSRATSDPFEDPVRGFADLENSRFARSEGGRAVNGERAASRPLGNLSSSQSYSTSSPRRPPPAKHATPIRTEKGTHRADPSIRNRQHVMSDDRNLRGGQGSAPPARAGSRPRT